jgi:hypothetical protein
MAPSSGTAHGACKGEAGQFRARLCSPRGWQLQRLDNYLLTEPQSPSGLQVNVPKTKRAFCKGCKKHMMMKVTQYKTGKASLYAQGEQAGSGTRSAAEQPAAAGSSLANSGLSGDASQHGIMWAAHWSYLQAEGSRAAGGERGDVG